MVETMQGSLSTMSEEVRQNGFQLAQLGRILLESIPEDKKGINAVKVMAYIAQQAIRSADDVSVPSKVSTKAIHTDLGGNANQEPSGWLSPLWKKIEDRYYPEIEEHVVAQCRNMGLTTYPVFKKLEGNPAYYTLAGSEIPDLPTSHESLSAIVASTDSDIEYKKDLTLKLSFLGRYLFQNGMDWTPKRRAAFLIGNLVFLLTIFCYFFSIGLSLWLAKELSAIQMLLLVLSGITVGGWAHRVITETWKVFDDRIAIAPYWALAWSEWGATIEIIRSKEPIRTSKIEVSRYSSTCPICGWMVRLESGKRGFSRRLIGRCEENPREHVFSFDRSTKLGKSLNNI